jgi:dolichol-phosphate mannosyltransferase
VSDALVIIPTYNEKENIRKIIAAVFALEQPFEVLVVDDGSPDGTGDIVKELQAAHPGILHLMERSGKQGLGTAYIAGFRWALARHYAYVIEMDADFSHDPNDLPRLYAACATGGGDVSVGSRYVKGGKVKNWPFLRWLMSYFASLYVRTVLWFPVNDTTAGFKCYRRKVLETINLDDIWFVGYAFQIEMKYSAWKLGFKVVEVPIVFIDRQFGESKMSIKIFKEAFKGVWKLRKKKVR